MNIYFSLPRNKSTLSCFSIKKALELLLITLNNVTNIVEYKPLSHVIATVSIKCPYHMSCTSLSALSVNKKTK